MDEETLSAERSMYRQEFLDRVALRILPALIARLSDEGLRPHAARTAYAIAADLWEARKNSQ